MTQHIHTHYTALYSSPNILTQVELSPAHMFDLEGEAVDDRDYAASGFVVWLRLFWDMICGASLKAGSAELPILSHPSLNRDARQHARRRAEKALPPARNFLPFLHLCRPSISGRRNRIKPRQFMERLARFSVWGRVSIYGLRREGRLAQRRAQLSCYDHGDWHAPVAKHYFLHLWPD